MIFFLFASRLLVFPSLEMDINFEVLRLAHMKLSLTLPDES